MGTLTATDPLLVAEDVWAYVKPSSLPARDDQGDVLLFRRQLLDRSEGGACRIRFGASAADKRIDDVRAWMAARGQESFTWWLGASTTPNDLEGCLLTRGAAPEPGSILTPMVLDDEPPPAPVGVEVRPISSFEDYGRALEITHDAVRVVDRDRQALRARIEEEWELARADHCFRLGAWINGELAADALLRPLTFGPPWLADTGALPRAAGRRALQALVRACWDTAVGLGTPGLVTQAGIHARPILERMGFRSGPPIHLLIDHSGLVSSPVVQGVGRGCIPQAAIE